MINYTEPGISQFGNINETIVAGSSSSTRKHFSSLIPSCVGGLAGGQPGSIGLLLFVYEFGNCVTSGGGTRQLLTELGKKMDLLD